MKIERAFSKEKILELYLNEIYLGIGAYGVAAASLLYFNKSVHELTLPEAAYLAALPKGPNNYHPFRRRDDAIARRNYVIDRMVEDRFITAQAGRRGQERPARGDHAPDRRADRRRRIFRRGSPPLHQRQVRREEALRGRPVGAHHARSEAAEGRAQGADRRPREVRREPRAIAARCRRSKSPATGAPSSPRSRRSPISRRGGWRWCSRSPTRPRASASSPAREPSGALVQASASSAPSRSTACAGRSRRPVRRAAGCRRASRRCWKSAT